MAPAPLCGKRTTQCKKCDNHRKDHKDNGCGHEFESRPCRRYAMANGCCQKHGGKSLTGIAHPNFQGKGQSRIVVLPARMQADYEAARNNPDRLSLEDEIAEIRALRKDLWRMLEGDSALAVAAVRAAAGAVHKAYRQAFIAHRAGNAEKFAEAMNALGEADVSLDQALGPVAAMEAARDKAADLAVKTEKLLRTENARIFDERGMVSLEAALADRYTLVVALLGAVTKHVGDSEVQKAIRRTVAAEYARLTGRRDTAADNASRGPLVLEAQHSTTVD